MKKHCGKKFVSLLLVIVLTMTTACGKSNNSNESANAEQNSTKAVAGDNADKGTVAEKTENEIKETVTGNQSEETTQKEHSENADSLTGTSVSEENNSSNTTATPTQKETSKQETATSKQEAQTSKPQSTTSAVGSNSGSTTLNKGEQMAKTIVDSIIKPGMSEFEKAIIINDWLTTNVNYDYTYTYRTVEQTLTYRKCVCEGYASTFYTMAKLAGLDVVYIVGQADNGSGYQGHAWNQVKIDGVWYNTDPTWNDNGNNSIDYDYFLISDATLSKNHKWAKDYANTCSVDYDIKKIYEYGIASGAHGDAIITTSESDALNKIDKYVKAGSNGVKLYYYAPTYNMSNDFYTSLQKYDIPVYARGVRDTVNNITLIDIIIIQPSELSKLPLVTNEEEFNSLYDKMATQDFKEYILRYEPENGDFSTWSNGWPDGVSLSSYYYKGKKCMIFYVHKW